MANRLDRDYGVFLLFRYAVPSMLSLLFLSLYQMVDAIFIANFIGENALAALNIVYPVISVMIAVTLMLSTGGSAIVAKKMGEGKQRESKEDFAVIMLTAVVLSMILSGLSLLFMEPLLTFLGATPVLRDDCVGYLGTLVPFMPLAAVQMGLSSFLITAGKPGLGFFLTAMSGISNIVLDYIFMVPLHMGIQGSAWGTAVGYTISAVPGILYFLFQRQGSLHFVRPKFRAKMLGFACFNGSSEMVSNLSVSVTTFLFNQLALQYMGEAGVTAVTVILYAQFFLTAVFMGFIGGIGPIFSFNLGSGNKRRLATLFRSSVGIVLVMTGMVIGASYLLAEPVVSVYIRRESDLFPLSLHGFLLFAIGYLFAGWNIYVSGLFTALQNGTVSAVISFMRTFVCLVLSLLFLPRWIGADGIWLAVPVAELISCLIATGFLIRYRKQYHFTLYPWREDQNSDSIAV